MQLCNILIAGDTITTTPSEKVGKAATVVWQEVQELEAGITAKECQGQTGPDGPKTSLLLNSTAFKENTQTYSERERVLLSLLQAVIQLEQLRVTLSNLSGPALLRLVVFYLSRNVTGSCASTSH